MFRVIRILKKMRNVHMHTVDTRDPNGPINAGHTDKREGVGVTCRERPGSDIMGTVDLWHAKRRHQWIECLNVNERYGKNGRHSE